MSLIKAEYKNVTSYLSQTISAVSSFALLTALSPTRFLCFVFNIFYLLAQRLIIWVFNPTPPRIMEQPSKPHGRIAVIGAGLTGVSSAAHAIAHGFDVVIFEKGDKVGGIWSHVNSTSGLQLNSFLYRFHPGVLWSRAFPLRDEILGEIERIWKEYRLESRTRFNTPVTSVRRAESEGPNHTADSNSQGHARWLVNEGEDGIFDAVVVTVGTCGNPRMIQFEGMPGEKQREADEGKQNGGSAGGVKSQTGHSSQKTGRALQNNGGQSSNAAVASEPPSDPIFNNCDTVQKHGQTGPWTHGQYESPQAVRHDQEVKQDTGFPAPAEAYPTSPSEDPQKDTKATSLLEGNGGVDQGDVFTKGPIVHSSELDKLSEKHVKGKTVIVVGSGASGVEAVETSLEKGAKKALMVAREDKWIIPRNIVLDTLISAQPFGRQMPLSFIWEGVVTRWNYYGVRDLVPKHLGIFEGTPVVNDDFLAHVRAGKCDYIRGDTQRFTKNGVRVNVRGRDSQPGDQGHVREFDGDVIVLATGYEKPDVGFLPEDLFPKDYERPNLYLQNFSTEDWSILMTNTAYMNAIGTVGHFHIGIYTRILLTLLMDESARPSPKDMKLWVDVIRFIKKGAKGGALGFFTYMELTIWLLLFHVFRTDRIRWVFFIMQGWGVSPAEYRS